MFRALLSVANSDISTSARLLRMEPAAPANSLRPLAARLADGRGKPTTLAYVVFNRHGFYASSNSAMASTFRVRGLKMMRSAYPDLPMSQMERIYKLDRLFRRKKPPGKREILDMFEISPAQFKRDLDYMRNRLGAYFRSPSTWRPATGGYTVLLLEEFNLPGLWFTEREVYSLLLMHSLLDQLQPDFVRELNSDLSKDKLRTLLGKSGRGTQSIFERMKVSAAPQRPIDPEHFQAISDATLRRKKLRMRYYSRSRGAESDRVVSPERLIYYRGNWYLDAWCHQKQAMRRFAIDAVRLASVLEEPALEVADVPSSRATGSSPGRPSIRQCSCSIRRPRAG